MEGSAVMLVRLSCGNLRRQDAKEKSFHGGFSRKLCQGVRQPSGHRQAGLRRGGPSSTDLKSKHEQTDKFEVNLYPRTF